jgi:peptidoglycan/LPS O-acetylase OafA/YrhL
VLAAVTFTMNYHPSRAWLLGHTWSMSVQEQFYFALPVVVLLFGVRGSTWAAIFTVAASPLARVASRYLFTDDLDSIGDTLPTVADAMATGVLLAALRGWLGRAVAAHLRLRAAWERRLFRTPTPAPERPGASAEPPSRSAEPPSRSAEPPSRSAA